VISWHDGVTGGLYGRLIGHIGILGIALILVVPTVLLLVIGWRLPRPEAGAEDAIELAAG
jgi:hypothetical protein